MIVTYFNVNNSLKKCAELENVKNAETYVFINDLIEKVQLLTELSKEMRETYKETYIWGFTVCYPNISVIPKENYSLRNFKCLATKRV